MKKYIMSFVVVLMMHNVQAMDLVNNDMYRWGTNKELAVAWYIYTYPKGHKEGDQAEIDSIWQQDTLQKKKVIGYLNNLQLITDVNSSRAPVELINMMATRFIYCYDPIVMHNEFAQKKVEEYLSRHWLDVATYQHYKNTDEIKKKEICNKMYKDIVLCIESDVSLDTFQNYLSLDEDHAKDFYINELNELLKQDIKEECNILTIQKDNINKKFDNFFVCEFIESVTSDFFKFFNDESSVKLKPGARALFKKDLLSLFNKEAVTEISHNKYCNQRTDLTEDKKNKLEEILQEVKSFTEAMSNINKETNKLIVVIDKHDLLLKIKSCNVRISCNIKEHGYADLHLNMSFNGLNRLNPKQVKWLNELRASNDKKGTLIKFNPELVKQWFELLDKMGVNETIENLRIDIESNAPTFLDRLIIDAPMLITALMPDLLFYASRHTGSLFVRALALTEFLGSCNISALLCMAWLTITKRQPKIGEKNYTMLPCSSYGIGYYIFPWLDATFNSHVKLLRSFFGADGVRTKIRRGESFMWYSIASWILSFIGNQLFSINAAAGLVIHGIRIPLYFVMYHYVSWRNPIDRGYPDNGKFFAPSKAEAMGYSYTLGDLKRPSNSVDTKDWR